MSLLHKNYFLFLFATILGLVLIFAFLFFVFAGRADIINQSGQYRVIYSSSISGQNQIISSEVTRTLSGFSERKSLLPDVGSNDITKELFFSPNRQYIAVTLNYFQPQTYIWDISQNQAITPIFLGSFRSWSPDSSKVLVYRSGANNEAGREIYTLDIKNNYSNIGLPAGTINAHISPINDSIVYSLTPNVIDDSDLWIRDINGNDEMILRGDHEIFSWVRWSPDGSQIAFLRSKINGKTPGEKRQLWVMNSDGTNARNVAEKILWSYPPIWSPNGNRILFAVQENEGENSIAVDYTALESNLWEYDISTSSSTKVTNFIKKKVYHPNYSRDGSQIVFISNQRGLDQVWIKENDAFIQITKSGGDEKRYPLIP